MSSGYQQFSCCRALALHTHTHTLTHCHTKEVIYLLLYRELRLLLCSGIISSHWLHCCWDKWWKWWMMEFYHLSCLQYEYGYQCLASLRLPLWFSAAAEALSGTVDFSTRQLVRTKTCLIFPPYRDVWFPVLNKRVLMWVNVSPSQ